MGVPEQQAHAANRGETNELEAALRQAWIELRSRPRESRDEAARVLVRIGRGEEASTLLAEPRPAAGILGVAAEALRVRCAAQICLGAYDEATRDGLEALEVFSWLGHDQGRAQTCNHIGIIHDHRGNKAEALDHFFKSLVLHQKLGDALGEAHVLNNIGIVYHSFGEKAKALEYYRKSLNLHQEAGNAPGEAVALGNIGIIYRQMGEHRQALRFFERGLKIHEQRDDQQGAADMLGNIGIVYRKREDFGRAISYYERARERYEQSGNRRGLTDTLINLGDVYLRKGDFAAALGYLDRGLAEARELGSKGNEFEALLYLGEIYQNADFTGYDLTRSISYLEASLATAQRINAKEWMFHIHLALSRAYETQGDVAKAFEAYKRYHETEAMVSTEDSEKRILNLQTALEVEQTKKEAELQRLKNLELSELNRRVQKQNQELGALNAELKGLNNEKNEFLGIAAHDLKSPLSSIRGMAQIIREEGGTYDKSEIMEMVSSIESAADRMFAIVTNLLDINRIEQGKMDLALGPNDLTKLGRTVTDDYLKRAAAKGIHLYFEAEDDLPPILGDRDTLLQVMENVLSNAVKYSPQGRNIWVRVYREGETARFACEDQGPGITAEDQAKLFVKFARLSAQPTGGEHSTGLGLAIVKRMMTAMNGRVWCKSVPGNGATFFLEFPLYRTPEVPAPAAPASIAAEEESTAEVLVVEDNVINQKLVVRILQLLGHSADTAWNGQEALEAMRRHRYRTILMDVNMPVMDGIEATRRIRDEFADDEQPYIIAVTAISDKKNQRECADAGMDAFVAKPVHSAVLKDALAQAGTPAVKEG